PFASVALLLRPSIASDIGPAMKRPPVLRIVTFCWNRPVAKLTENPPRVMVTGTLMSLAHAHAFTVRTFSEGLTGANRGAGDVASAKVTVLTGANAAKTIPVPRAGRPTVES